MRSLLVILSLLFVLGGSGCQMFGKKKKEQAQKEAQHRKDSIRKATEEAERIAELKLQAEQARKDSIAMAEEAQRRLYKFHIIVGSFKTPQYATSYNDLFSPKGYQTELIENEYNFQLVSIGSFKSWSSAVRELERIREEIEEAWIYIRQ